jgi:hypothetical protein
MKSCFVSGRKDLVHVLLPVVLRAIHPTVCLILHKHPHELILGGQQILKAD